ncbi:MAG: repressor LexA [Gammaproteobacteria bacterium RIFCSPHIGHO2_02_FULL_42_13]|nr:MAG: repressor LexA [Gammaproteobacteria bacterium RIFCSPHIGHO2_02_FULL_42_13]
MPLTPKQKKVLEFVKKYSSRHEFSPSLREIGKHIGVSSPATVHQHLTALERKGFLGREKSQPRSITIQPLESIESPYSGAVGVNSMTLPIVGSANCGPAEILAEENIEGYLKISTSLLNRRDGLFVVRASGDSMNRANFFGKTIEDGDFVIIDSLDRSAKHGDYVLSIIDGCANLKKFISDRNGQKMLLSESKSKKNYKPIFLHEADDFMVNGKIISVIKK